MSAIFHVGDAGNFDILAGLGSLDCIVQDPPAGIAFMGTNFDRDHGGRDAWIKAHAGLFAAGRRAMKPGAWSLTWALPRTSHWTACALDDAGWEITDCITHLNGQGWPKNARTQLKPAAEHWYLARNGGGGALQIDAARVARGALDWPEEGRVGGHSAKPGVAKITGAPPGDGVRCPPAGSWPTNALLSHAPCCRERGTREVKGEKPRTLNISAAGQGYGGSAQSFTTSTVGGSANGLETVPAFDCLAACSCGLTLLSPAGGQAPRCSCGEAMVWTCPVADLDGQSGHSVSPRLGNIIRNKDRIGTLSTDGLRGVENVNGHGDSGGASRFFPTFAYAAKAATAERNAGAEHLLWARDAAASFGWRAVDREAWEALPEGERGTGCIHPTVKSLKLARWLVRLLCPPGGRGGDPFCGSGSIGIAAMQEGFDWISSDLSPEAIAIARARLTHWEAVKAAEDKAAYELANPQQRSLFALMGGT